MTTVFNLQNENERFFVWVGTTKVRLSKILWNSFKKELSQNCKKGNRQKLLIVNSLWWNGWSIQGSSLLLLTILQLTITQLLWHKLCYYYCQNRRLNVH
jgi:hypothetical protein